MEELAIGTPVKFVEPQDDYEESLTMYVLEDYGSRVRVADRNVTVLGNHHPQMVYLKSDLVIAE